MTLNGQNTYAITDKQKNNSQWVQRSAYVSFINLLFPKKMLHI